MAYSSRQRSDSSASRRPRQNSASSRASGVRGGASAGSSRGSGRGQRGFGGSSAPSYRSGHGSPSQGSFGRSSSRGGSRITVNAGDGFPAAPSPRGSYGGSAMGVGGRSGGRSGASRGVGMGSAPSSFSRSGGSSRNGGFGGSSYGSGSVGSASRSSRGAGGASGRNRGMGSAAGAPSSRGSRSAGFGRGMSSAGRGNAGRAGSMGGRSSRSNAGAASSRGSRFGGDSGFNRSAGSGRVTSSSNPRGGASRNGGSFDGSSRRSGDFAGSRGSSKATYVGASRSGRRNEAATRSVRIGDLNRPTRTGGVGTPTLPSGCFGKALIALIIIAVLVIGYMALYFSPLFKINNVNVEGGEHVTQEQVLEAAQIPDDATMLRVDVNAIKRNVESIGWVGEATVTTMIPDTLNISISEATIAAIAEIPSKDAKKTEVWGISSKGTWLMNIPKEDSPEAAKVSAQVFEDAKKVLRITGVPYGIEPEEGTVCTDEHVNNALSIIRGMTTELKDKVKTVSADGAETTTLILDNGVEIAFGSGEDIRDKERVCLALLKKHKDNIAYINVRIVNRPTWRAL